MLRKLFYHGAAWMLMISGGLYGQKIDKPNVAIHDFKDVTGKSAAFLPVVNSTIRDYLFRTKRFDVIDRENLQSVLKEKELQLSGLTEDDTKALQDILEADYLMVGEIAEASVRKGTLRESVTEKKVPTKWDEDGDPIEWTLKKYRMVSRTYNFVVRLSAKIIDVGTSEISQQEVATVRFETNISRTYESLNLGLLGNIVLHLLEPNIKKEIESKVVLDASVIQGIKNDMFKRAAYTLTVKLIEQIKMVGKILDIEGTGKPTFIINLGRNNGLFKKCNLIVYEKKRYGEGESAIEKEVDIATLIVTTIKDDYSEARIFKGEASQVSRGDFVRVVKRQAKWTAAIPSMLVPGLSQVMYGKYQQGITVFVLEAALIGILGVPTLLGVYDAWIKPENRLDNIVERDGNRYDAGGQITESTGRVNDNLDFWIDFTGWMYMGVGLLVYLGNIYEATYPAWNNPVLENRLYDWFRGSSSLRPYIDMRRSKGAGADKQMTTFWGLRWDLH